MVKKPSYQVLPYAVLIRRPMKKKKIYNVLWEEDGNYYDGVVLAVNETKSGIEQEMKKRASVPHFHHCDSASDLSDIDKASTTSSVVQAGASSVEAITKKKIAEATERRKNQTKLNGKPNTTTDKSLSSASGGGCPANSNKGIKRSALQGDLGPEAKKKLISTKQTNIDSPGIDKKKSTKCDLSTKSGVPKILSVTDVKQKYVVKDDQTRKNSVEMIQIEVHETSGIIENHDEHENETETENSKMIDTGRPSDEGQLGGSSSHVGISSEKYKSVVEELKRLKAENLALKKKYTAYDRSIAKQRGEIESLHDLNADALKVSLDMQKQVIKKMEGFSELTEIVRNLKQKSIETFERDGNFPPVGYKNSENNEYHIGCGLWLSEALFNTLLTHTNPKLFAREAARVLFGTTMLLRSTVTGKQSNRDREKANKEKPLALDATKLNAIAAFMEYFLDDNRFKNMSVVTKRTHIIRTGSYIGQYIADLKKGQTKKNKGNTKNDIGDDTCGLARSFELDPLGSGLEETAESEVSNGYQDIDGEEDALYLNIEAEQHMESIEDEEKTENDALLEDRIEEHYNINDKFEAGEEEEN